MEQSTDCKATQRGSDNLCPSDDHTTGHQVVVALVCWSYFLSFIFLACFAFGLLQLIKNVVICKLMSMSGRVPQAPGERGGTVV